MYASELTSALRRAYDEAFNRRNLNALDEVFANDMVDRSVAKAEEQVGLDGFKRRIAGHHAGVSDLEMELYDVVASGQLVAFRWHFTGTHDGPWLGRPATGKTFTLTGINMERIDHGRIVEHFSYPDLLGLFRQLGFS
jgi:steroid delta-isomerase-like uncharacterized protein